MSCKRADLLFPMREEQERRMKVALLVLALALAFVSDRLVRTENQRYALIIGMCPGRTGLLADSVCLERVQTRTSWFWHLYYGLAEDHPAVPPFRS